MAEPSRLAGTMVGAILESTGYHYQQAILEAFQSPFENEIGGLIYLFAIVLAVVYSATQGGFRMSAWLLIGPPLFFAIIQVQQPINNARWEFGVQARDQSQAESAINRATGTAETQATVSTVFARYVEMVSATVRGIVDTLSRGRENADIWFLVKAQLFAMLHTAEGTDPGLIQLFHHGLLLECAEEVRYAQAIHDPLFREFDPNDPVVASIAASVEKAREWFQPTRDYAQKKFDENFYLKDVNVTDETARYLAALRLGGAALQGEDGQRKLNEEAARIQKTPMSCAEVWRWITVGIHRDVQRRHEELEATALRHGIPEDIINNLLLQASGVDVEAPVTFAGDLRPDLPPGIQGPPAPGNDFPSLDVNRILRIMSLYYLRNEFTKDDKGSWISYMASRHESRLLRTRLDGQSSMTERSRISVLEWSEKERLIHNASSLPYYQGIILYFLGALFPFFALLLLIPGKHSGFLLWFALWFWAKSWDIGFAVVMLLDDVLFAVFAVEKQGWGSVREFPVDQDAGRQMGLAFKALQELDPTFQLSTYYTIVSVALMAVPIASAQLFLGTMAQGASIIEKGARAFSDAFADSAHHHMIRDANTYFRNEANMLLQRRAQANLNTQQVSQNLAVARDSALKHGIDLNDPTGRSVNGIRPDSGHNPRPGATQSPSGAPPGQVGIPSNQHESTVGSNPQPQVDGNARRAAREDMADAGFLAGRSNTFRPFGGEDSLYDLGLKIASTAQGQQISNARGEATLGLLQAEYAYEATRLQWIAVNEDIRDLHMRAAPYGILPLPPSGFYPEPSQQMYQMGVARFNQEMQLRKAVIETYADLTTEVLKAGKAVMGNGFKIADLPNLSDANKQRIRQTLGASGWMLTAFGVGMNLGNATDNAQEREEMLRRLDEHQRQQQQAASSSWYNWMRDTFHIGEEVRVGQWAYERSSTPEESFMVSRYQHGKYDLPDRPGEKRETNLFDSDFGSLNFGRHGIWGQRVSELLQHRDEPAN